jgi:hypothetical protein
MDLSMKNAAIYYVNHLICKQRYAYNCSTIIFLLYVQEPRLLSEKTNILDDY